jgi:hypothetical protein
MDNPLSPDPQRNNQTRGIKPSVFPIGLAKSGAGPAGTPCLTHPPSPSGIQQSSPEIALRKTAENRNENMTNTVIIIALLISDFSTNPDLLAGFKR